MIYGIALAYNKEQVKRKLKMRLEIETKTVTCYPENLSGRTMKLLDECGLKFRFQIQQKLRVLQYADSYAG